MANRYRLQEALNTVVQICQAKYGTVQVLANDGNSFVVDCAFEDHGQLNPLNATFDTEAKIKAALTEAEMTVIDRAYMSMAHQNHTYLRVQLREDY